MEKGKLFILLGKLGRFHLRRCYTEYRKKGITQGQPRILRYLHSHPDSIQRELCDHCQLEPATATNILSRMEREGLVERHYQFGNRRSLHVSLTQEGKACFFVAEHVNQTLEDETFMGFSPEEKELAAKFIERICENLERFEGKSRNV